MNQRSTWTLNGTVSKHGILLVAEIEGLGTKLELTSKFCRNQGLWDIYVGFPSNTKCGRCSLEFCKWEILLKHDPNMPKGATKRYVTTNFFEPAKFSSIESTQPFVSHSDLSSKVEASLPEAYQIPAAVHPRQ
jgi:hypothetical protein